MTSRIVNVDLQDRSYEIHIGPGVIHKLPSLLEPILNRRKVAIITDETVQKLHLQECISILNTAGIETVSMAIPVGETSKSWLQLQNCVEWLLDEGIERDDVVIAFGGGVVGDLVGFSASITRRGVRFVQVPTTLLAQVDSSVGGKTGINSPHGKNLVGVFAQPQFVLADTNHLKTLSPRDFRAGLGEVVKYGLLGNPVFFEWLEKNGDKLKNGDVDAQVEAIQVSCQMKADIVGRDEKEQGERALLNLGHTFGHALEAATGYSSRLLHGEGVSIGCQLAFELSSTLGICSQEAPSRTAALFDKMSMKYQLKDIEGELPDADALIQLMYQDKKVQQGNIAFIMPESIGKCYVDRDVDLEQVKLVLNRQLSER